jgi:CheY-like chemotaxis protein
VRNSARRRLNETELQSYYSRSSGGVNSELSAPVNLSAYRNLKVLLVDDSAIARKMVERTLTQLENCQCDHAHNGLEAVHKVAQSLLPGPNGEPPLPYDVVLMDYYMPVMSGPEAVHLIRQGGYRGVVLAVTGVSTDSEFTSLLGKGVDRILVKPFKLETFIHMMGGSGKRADSPFAVLPTQEELA